MPSLKSLFGMGNSKAMSPEESNQIFSELRETQTRKKGVSKSKTSSRNKVEALRGSEIDDIHAFVLSLKGEKEGEELLKRFVQQQGAFDLPPDIISISIPSVQRNTAA